MATTLFIILIRFGEADAATAYCLFEINNGESVRRHQSIAEIKATLFSQKIPEQIKPLCASIESSLFPRAKIMLGREKYAVTRKAIVTDALCMRIKLIMQNEGEKTLRTREEK